MRKQPTGEPDAGDPHVRFGGEGASAPLPNRILTRTVRRKTVRSKALSLKNSPVAHF